MAQSIQPERASPHHTPACPCSGQALARHNTSVTTSLSGIVVLIS
jgi:hypothetical protein